MRIPKWNPDSSLVIKSMLNSNFTIVAVEHMNQASLTATFINDVLTISGALDNTIRPNDKIRFRITEWLNPISTSVYTGFTVST